MAAHQSVIFFGRASLTAQIAGLCVVCCHLHDDSQSCMHQGLTQGLTRGGAHMQGSRAEAHTRGARGCGGRRWKVTKRERSRRARWWRTVGGLRTLTSSAPSPVAPSSCAVVSTICSALATRGSPEGSSITHNPIATTRKRHGIDRNHRPPGAHAQGLTSRHQTAPVPEKNALGKSWFRSTICILPKY